MSFGIAKKAVQRRERTGRHDVCLKSGHRLDARGQDIRAHATLPHRRAQEDTFAGITFHERDPCWLIAFCFKDRYDEPREPAASSKVDPMPCRWRRAVDLDGILDVTLPSVVKRLRRNQIDSRRPFAHELQQRPKPALCFT